MHFQFDTFSYQITHMTVKSSLAGSNVCGEIRVLWLTTWARGQSGLKGGGGQGALLHSRPAIPFPHFLFWPRVPGWGSLECTVHGQGQGIHLSQRRCGSPGFPAFQAVPNRTLNSTHPSLIHPPLHSFIYSFHPFILQTAVCAGSPSCNLWWPQ